MKDDDIEEDFKYGSIILPESNGSVNFTQDELDINSSMK
jgi:hypothetical protein